MLCFLLNLTKERKTVSRSIKKISTLLLFALNYLIDVNGRLENENEFVIFRRITYRAFPPSRTHNLYQCHPHTELPRIQRI